MEWVASEAGDQGIGIQWERIPADWATHILAGEARWSDHNLGLGIDLIILQLAEVLI
jgi:hypothetical protein